MINYLQNRLHAVCILLAGMNFPYILPELDILRIELFHIKVKDFGKISKEVDLFIKNDLSLFQLLWWKYDAVILSL